MVVVPLSLVRSRLRMTPSTGRERLTGPVTRPLERDTRPRHTRMTEAPPYPRGHDATITLASHARQGGVWKVVNVQISRIPPPEPQK